MRYWVGIILAALLLPVIASGKDAATESPLVVETSVSRARITIGDQFEYVLRAELSDPSLELEEPSPGRQLGQFEIKDIAEDSGKLRGGGVYFEGRYVLSTYFTGNFEIPPLTVGYLDSSGQRHEVRTLPIEIVVESIAESLSAEDDILDIKPPVSIPRRHTLLFWTMIGIVVLLGVGWAIWFAFSMRAGRKEEVSPLAALPPHEEAYVALEALAATDLPAQGKFKTYYTNLSEIFRIYVGRRYRVSATDMTSSELLAALLEYPIGGSWRDRLRELCGLCDVVKFAKFKPTVAESRGSLELVRQFVDETRELRETETAPQEAVA